MLSDNIFQDYYIRMVQLLLLFSYLSRRKGPSKSQIKPNRQAKVQLTLAPGWRMIDLKRKPFLMPALPESLE